MKSFISVYTLLLILFQIACKEDSNTEMVRILAEKFKTYSVKENSFCPEAEFSYYDSLYNKTFNPNDKLMLTYLKSKALVKIGREAEAVAGYEYLLSQVGYEDPNNIQLVQELALAYLRLGERQNCINNHSVESCIMPIRNTGIHKLVDGSQKAIQTYKFILDRLPEDYESRWLMNIAYMTLGQYPQGVPEKYLIPGLDKNDELYSVKPFEDVAPNLGLNLHNMAGAVILDDFNNDNYTDIVITDWGLGGAMHYFQNDLKGGYSDLSSASELGRFKGGLNMIQADYDNDGDLDIYVLRGAWMTLFGKQPNSLLQNDGNGKFKDVTKEAGLYDEHPTQTGVWRDFNKDGFLDLYVGNESAVEINDIHPCQLFINDGKGKFKDVAQESNCKIIDFVKAVNVGDFDNDGLDDIVLSGMRGKRHLLRNTKISNGIPIFEDVTNKSGLGDITDKNSFSSWFWDYDNDGWQDIFICGYDFVKQPIGNTLAREALGITNNLSGTNFLYHNNHDGTFTNVTNSSRLNKGVFGMGSNFFDLDNDGYMDMFIGTGNPDYRSIIPNRMFRNMGNGTFADVSVSARVGSLQKGHAVSMNDLDNDGDSDIFIEIGGAFIGDKYNNSLFINPYQNENNWLKLKLEGTSGNKCAIGSKIKVSFKENGIQRNVYSEVNSGGSFGAKSLRQEIGIGKAAIIDELEIIWSKSNFKQVFKNVKPNQTLKIKEQDNNPLVLNLNKFDYKLNKGLPMCDPNTKAVIH